MVLPNDECERIEALRRCHILDTAPEDVFDELALLAAQICRTPIALITLVDAKREWFKSKFGLTVDEIALAIGADCNETPNICAWDMGATKGRRGRPRR